MRAWLCLLLIGVSVHAEEDPWGPYGEVCYVGQAWQYNKTASFDVPWFTIDLDADPETRWNLVATTYSKQITAALGTVEQMLSLLPGLYNYLVNLCGDNFDYLPEPYKAEISGMARASGISRAEISLLNMFYEIAKGCTSIVAQTPEGRIYHARNQDFGTFFIWDINQHTWEQTIALKNILINVNFIKGGKLLFKGVTFAGHLGILTGLRPHGFTLSTNARFGNTRHNLQQFFHGLNGNREFLLYADRDVLTQCATYACAIDWLENTPLIASGYFIVGGRNPGEGAIVTRGPNGTDHIQFLDASQPDGWFLLQTNWDWDKKELYLDQRIGPGTDCMNRLGQKNVGHQGLYQVLSSKPNLNKATVYTSVMQVDDSLLESYIRKCDDPCWFV